MHDHRGMTIPALEKQVAAQIIEMMNTHGLRWTQRWATTLPPQNGLSKHAYRGVNALTTGIWLMCAAEADPRFLTFFQASQKGAKIRKGSKGIPILYYGTMTREEDGEEVRSRFAKISYLFHVSQIDGLELPALPSLHLEAHERNARIEAYVANCAIPVQEGTAAYYSPGKDVIVMPPLGLFRDSPEVSAEEFYYSTLLHELIHATGEEGRAHRPERKRCHTDERELAREELVAEIGAAMLGQMLGLQAQPREDNAAYVKSWVRLLTDKPAAIFAAASAASRAIQWIEDQQPAEQEIAA